MNALALLWSALLATQGLARQPSEPAEGPVLAPPLRLDCDTGPIDIGHAGPLYADLDGDGNSELVVGNVSGYFQLYANAGEKGQPDFVAKGLLQAEGKDAFVKSWSCIALSPRLADFDGDGNFDLYTGTFEGGLYRLPGKGKGEFGAPEKVLDKSGEVLRLGEFWNYDTNQWDVSKSSNVPDEFGVSAPAFGVSAAAVDWDGDGDLDFVLGSSSGRMFLRRNLGTAKCASFALENEPVLAWDLPLDVKGGHAMPVVADWDGDGAWDLISANDQGSVQWWRNTGKRNAPKFGRAVELVAASSRTDDAPGMRAQVTTCDFDGDGKLDLLLGDCRDCPMSEGKSAKSEHHGYVWFFRRL